MILAARGKYVRLHVVTFIVKDPANSGDTVRILDLKRGEAKSSRKIAIFLLLAYTAMGTGLVDSPVLCLGEDGHLAMESAVSCAFCGVRSVLPYQQESMIPEGNPASGCGPCQDFSIPSAREYPGIASPVPPGSERMDIALPSIESAEGSRTTNSFGSSVSGPLEIPDPTAFHARTVILLI